MNTRARRSMDRIDGYEPSDVGSIPTAPIEIFYDGNCKFCAHIAKKIELLDKNNTITLTNLIDEPYAPELYGIKFKDAMAQIHGTDGESVFCGFDLVLKIIESLGYTNIVTICNLPGIRQICSVLFWLISKFRRII